VEVFIVRDPIPAIAWPNKPLYARRSREFWVCLQFPQQTQKAYKRAMDWLGLAMSAQFRVLRAGSRRIACGVPSFPFPCGCPVAAIVFLRVAARSVFRAVRHEDINRMKNCETMLRGAAIVLVGWIALFALGGCTVTLVQPYDENLFDDTEAFYKKASAMILDGEMVSPLRDDDRAKILNPKTHTGHYSKFEQRYQDLITDTDLLILRATANYQTVDAAGAAAQEKANQAIEEKIKNQCPELTGRLRDVGLTAANYVDLQCLIITWQKQHADSEFTENTHILKKANWQGRRKNLFDAVLAIQRAEAFKKKN